MTIPREDTLAFFPPSVTAGNVVLWPLTLAGAVRLAGLGVDLGGRVPKDKVFAAAWVLSGGAVTRGRVTLPNAVKRGRTNLPNAVGSSVPLDRTTPPDEVGSSVPLDRTTPPDAVGSSVPLDRFLSKARVGLEELSNAVEKVFNDAFETYVKPRREKDETPTVTPHGLGWPLEYAEFLCGEYGWSWETAINTPVATVFALVAANRQRNGGKHGGFDYIEKELMRR